MAWPSAREAKRPAFVDALIRSQLPRIRQRLRSLFPALELDELEQQVVLNVLCSLPRYRGEGSLHAWVDRITLRVGFKHARRTRARQRTERVLIDHLLEAQEQPHSELYLVRRQLQRLLAALPPKQERAVLLRHVMGLKISEVAENQGISTETARSRLRLAMQKLRLRSASAVARRARAPLTRTKHH